MLITRRSAITGKTHTLDIPATQEQMDAFNSGVFAQTAFPNLKASDREFILSGVTEEEWNKVFPPEEEEVPDGEGT